VIRVGTDRGLLAIGASQPLLPDRAVSHLCGDWAVVAGHELRALGSGLALPAPAGLTLHCVLDGPDGVLAGSSGAHLLRPGPAGGLEPVGSFEAIPSRHRWYTPWGGPPDTRSLAAAPDGTVFVNVHVGGVWRADPGLTGWEEVVEVDADAHQVAVDPATGAVVVAAAVGFGVSRDGGRTFSFDDDGLHGSYCRAVAVGAGRVFVTASTGPGSRRGALYRRDLSGHGPFHRCAKGLPEWFPFNLDTHQLAAAGSEVALGTDDGRVWRSTDAGATWELVAEGLGPVHCVAVS
jgi:hypothetical protein